MAKENSYKIGRFKIVRRIGKGAQGSVFLAEDPYLQRRVAIKVLTFKSQDQEVRKRALLQEAGAVGRLKHPNRPTILKEPPTLYLNMYMVFPLSSF